MAKVNSIFRVSEVDLRKNTTSSEQEVTVSGVGQDVVNFLRKEYAKKGKVARMVLEGFEVNGNFVALNTYPD